MERKRYAEEKIILILKGSEAGASVPDRSRRYGIVENTNYRWKSKFGGWRFQRPSDCVNSRRRTESSNIYWQKLSSTRQR